MIKTKKAWSTSTQVNILWGGQWKTKSERNILQSILALPLALQKYNLVHKYTCILKVLVTSLSQQLKWLLLYFGLSFLFTFLCMASTKNDIIAVSCIASLITRIKNKIKKRQTSAGTLLIGYRPHPSWIKNTCAGYRSISKGQKLFCKATFRAEIAGQKNTQPTSLKIPLKKKYQFNWHRIMVNKSRKWTHADILNKTPNSTTVYLP